MVVIIHYFVESEENVIHMPSLFKVTYEGLNKRPHKHTAWPEWRDK